jgi:hypothetical protein
VIDARTLDRQVSQQSHFTSPHFIWFFVTCELFLGETLRSTCIASVDKITLADPSSITHQRPMLAFAQSDSGALSPIGFPNSSLQTNLHFPLLPTSARRQPAQHAYLLHIWPNRLIHNSLDLLRLIEAPVTSTRSRVRTQVWIRPRW